MKRILIIFSLFTFYSCSQNDEENVEVESEQLLINKIEGFWWINEVPDPDYDYLTEYISIKFYDDDKLWARENRVLVNNNTKEAFSSNECTEYSLFEENGFCDKVEVITSTKDTFCVLETSKKYVDETRTCLSLIDENTIKVEHTSKFMEGEKLITYVESAESKKSTEPYSECNLFEYEDYYSSCILNDCELMSENCSNENIQGSSNDTTNINNSNDLPEGNSSNNNIQNCDISTLQNTVSSISFLNLYDSYNFDFGKYTVTSFSRGGVTYTCSPTCNWEGIDTPTTVNTIRFTSSDSKDPKINENSIWVEFSFNVVNNEIVKIYTAKYDSKTESLWSYLKEFHSPNYKVKNITNLSWCSGPCQDNNESICEMWEDMNEHVKKIK